MDALEHMLRNVRTISDLPQGSKLSTVAGVFINVDQPRPFQWLRRWIDGDDRYKAVTQIRKIVDDVIFISTLHIKLADSRHSDYASTVNTLRSIHRDLSLLPNGLNKLISTYQTDINIVSPLTDITKIVTAHISEIVAVLRSNNEAVPGDERYF